MSFEKRRAPRLTVSRDCSIVIEGVVHAARLTDISTIGAQVTTDQRPEIGGKIELKHPGIGSLEAFVVRHADAGIGLYFEASNTLANKAFSMIKLETDKGSG